MKGYFKSALYAVAALVLSGSIFFTGCTEVDDSLGLGMVPDDQRLVVVMDTIKGVKAYVAKEDSQPTSHLRRMVLGSRKTDFGVTSASGIYQFMPLESSESRGESYFGKGAKVHEAYIALYINNISGNTNVEQTFYVYPLVDTMRYDTTYYANFDPFTASNQSLQQKVDLEKGPIFKFTLKDEITGRVFKKIWEVKTGDEELAGGEFAEGDELYNRGRKYLKDIIALEKEVWDDETQGKGLFHKAFPGFYIVRASDVKEYAQKNGLQSVDVDVDEEQEAAIYEILMADSYFLEDLSYLTMLTHTPKNVSGSALNRGPYSRTDGETEPQYDTLETRFYFDDQASEFPALSNLSVAMIRHDYSGSLLASETFADTVAVAGNGATASTPRKTFYVQSMLGASGYLHFDAALKEKLREILEREDEQYRSVYINKALLSIPLAEDADAADYHLASGRAPQRVGLYLNMKGVYPVNIPDYPYLDEAVTNNRSTFGGYLNYSKGRYEMDISTYLRQLILNPGGTRDRIWLSPAWSLNSFSRLDEVILENDPDGKEIELAITYTLIK